ncbi:CoA-transferase [Bosea sp. (in: a-proteobacteria)]|uniref:CoA-transferase n=1 Tax=Bosea sp. (in: a-proteobacteria) TaxID=1871050 RepID=UPI0026132DEB|nr:CoA-transferase [Bosea sp. (in: a-proteobacteria)]MCO5090375.1 acyl CoA:acetate/3-ketoacid CoA transferase [Bosea sp. (in: a-proteobacteria)]
MKVIEAREAVSVIRPGMTVAISGGGYRVVPETLIAALAEEFARSGSPRDLTIIAVAMLERGRSGKGGEGTGLNRIARAGLMKRIIVSSFSRSATRELNQAIVGNEVAAYNFPMGTIVQWLRAIGAGRPGLLTEVGLGTYVDPRDEAGRVNAAAAEPLSRIVEVAGHEMIFYPRLPVDVALIKASAADARGNLFFDREAFDHGVFEIALAARGCGGKVIAEVNRIVPVGEIHPRMGRIPGAFVDAVVVQPEAWEDEQDPILTGARREALPAPVDRGLARDVIARAVVADLPQGAMVNLGAGIPMYDVPEAARLMGRDDIYFSVEQGPMGGWPQVGGVSRNVEMILEQHEVFQIYEGGAADVSVLSFGEVDRHGNVNVSRFAGMLPGSGGFINITHGIRNLIFCGTLTTGGLAESFSRDGVSIQAEGRIKRFVPKVEQVTFNGPRAFAQGRSITLVTERGIFVVDGDGFRLVRIAPGIRLDEDIRAQILFPITIAPELKIMPPELFGWAAA